MQRLSGCHAALGRFISKLGERGIPPFKLLKTLEAEQALQGLKQYLTSLPILVAPRPEEPLLLYITVREHRLGGEREETSEPKLRPEPPAAHVSNQTVGSKLPAPSEKMAGTELATEPKLPPSLGLAGAQAPVWPRAG